VQPPGSAWAVAGYSEGGFCAAELGLRFGRDYGYAGVLSRVAVHLVDGGGHSMFTWRGLVPSMLSWMTPRLTKHAERDTRLALAAVRHARQKAEARARAAARHHRHHHHRRHQDHRARRP
jgi:hypothetical protein